jgi:hypothetical protein
MTQITILEEIVGELRRRIEGDSLIVAGGGATSYEDYVRRTAGIKAYKHAVDLIYEIVKTKPGEERT